jgi:hypothetical protein
MRAALAALTIGASVLALTPVMAQTRSGGGHSGTWSGSRGGSAGGFRGGGSRGGGFRGGGFYGGPYYGGYYNDPFFWGGLGFLGGYALAAPVYYDSYDSYYPDAPPPPVYGGAYPGAPPPADYGDYRDSGPRQAAPPSRYDCDGWRWDATTKRYVAAKVSCN